MNECSVLVLVHRVRGAHGPAELVHVLAAERLEGKGEILSVVLNFEPQRVKVRGVLLLDPRWIELFKLPLGEGVVLDPK